VNQTGDVPENGLVEVLDRARELGFLGPGPVEAQLAHARGFAEVVSHHEAEAVPGVDLGSGGGLPGLPLAVWWPASRWVLLDANRRRTEFLRWAVATLGLEERVRVVHRRAESFAVGHERGRYPLVVARGFGRPAVVAECTAPLLCVGGRLVVSEPPEDGEDRWPDAGLAQLGMRPGPLVQAGGARFRTLGQAAPCPDRFPRRVGRAGHSPLF